MYPNGKHATPEPEELPEGTPGGVEEVGAFLRRWHDPAPDPAAKADLLRLLADEMESRAPSRAHNHAPQQRITSPRNLRWAWLLLRSQTRLVHPATWAASGLVIALGALVTLAFYHSARSGAELPLVIVAPLVAACGVAFLYGLEADPALELQLATPVSSRLILLARLALLFGFNLAITLTCSVALVLARVELSLLPLVVAWLAPMTFLSALAFLLSVLFFDSLASVMVCLLLWIGAALRHFVQFEFVLPDLLHANFHPVMLLAAPVLVIVALWLAEHEERWTGGQH
jgi:hypothetical protein